MTAEREKAIDALKLSAPIMAVTQEAFKDYIQTLNKVMDWLEQEPILDKIRAEIKEWYWQADKQALAKDPCVVDAMIDLFIRTIDKYNAESEE